MREKAHVTLAALFLAGCPLNEVIRGTSGGLESSSSGEGGETTSTSRATAEPTSGTTDPSTDPVSSGTTTTGDTSTNDPSDTSGGTSGTSDTSTTTSTSTSTSSGDNTLVIEGLGEFPVTCALDDADCGARTACELTTNEPCEYVEYDCQLLNVGSYTIAAFYDEPRDFSFALYPLIERTDFGNICSCLRTPTEGKALLQSYGLATDHEWCGLGRWYLK